MLEKEKEIVGDLKVSGSKKIDSIEKENESLSVLDDKEQEPEVETVLDVFRIVKDAIEKALRPFKYTIRSCGTKNEGLKNPVSEITGYWADPGSITSKPPRWIVQFEKDENKILADFAKQPNGNYYPSASTIGYINNRQGNCSVVIVRVFATIKDTGTKYIIPGWEWLIALIFAEPLPAGTSGQSLSNFNPIEGTIGYSNETHNIEHLAIFKTPVKDNIVICNNDSLTYEEATIALRNFLSGRVGGEND